MLEFTNRKALPFSMNDNSTEFEFNGFATAGILNNRNGNNGGDSITACLDSKRQKIVPIGEYYYADPCTLCLCSNSEYMCKQISCAPPEKCDGYIKKDPMHCCDVCVPAVVVERPNDTSGLNLKLGALTVALFLVISLILFTLHRMRRKRLLVSMRRWQTFRRRDSTCSHNGDGPRHSIDAADGVLFSTTVPGILSPSECAAVIAEGPPPYNAAVTLPRAPESLALAPPRCTAPLEPPPTYRQTVNQDFTTIRRCTSQNGVVAGGRRSRTSDYHDDDDHCEDDDNEDVDGASTCSSSSSSSSSTATSLSSSRDSLNTVDETNLSRNGDDDCCSCSQCDSGLSEERGSFSSNEIRPRSEMLQSVSNYNTILTQNFSQSHQLLRQIPSGSPQQQSPQAPTSASVSTGNREHDGTGNGNENEPRRGRKGKLCKKKLKKLMIKARRKAARKGKRNNETENESEIGECSHTTQNRTQSASRRNHQQESVVAENSNSNTVQAVSTV